MNQTLFCLEIIISLCVVCGVADYISDTTYTTVSTENFYPSDTTGTYCAGSEWVAYKNEKCFKIIKKFATRYEAEEICKKERSQTNSFVPELVSIKSADEQNYLANLIFNNLEVKSNVWIGAERRSENNNQFVWSDGSSINFKNWVEGSPSQEIGRDCVEMESRFTKQFCNTSNLDNHAIYGQWKDVTCESGNYFICQKLQTWSFPQLQKTLLDVRMELRNTRNQLHNTENKVEDLQRNPVPIGFIYTQLPGQPEPMNLWPKLQWTDVSSEYAGLFFRAEGGGSAHLGEIQSENSPRLIAVNSKYKNGVGVYNAKTVLNTGETSRLILTGGSGDNGLTLSFEVSAGEVRPRNMAMRIWKRIN